MTSALSTFPPFAAAEVEIDPVPAPVLDELAEFVAQQVDIAVSAVNEFVAGVQVENVKRLKQITSPSLTTLRAFLIVRAAREDKYKDLMEQIEAAATSPSVLKRVSLRDFKDRLEVEALNFVSPEDELEKNKKRNEKMASDRAAKKAANRVRIMVHGRVGTDFYYSSSELQELLALSPQQHSKNYFIALAPIEYWLDQHGRVNKDGDEVVDWDRVTSRLMAEARAKSDFDPNNLRSRGPWIEQLENNQTRFVYNTGRHLIVDGKVVEYEAYEGKYFYCAASPVIEVAPAEEQLEKEARDKFYEVIAGLRWAEPHHPILVIGWITMAVIAGALSWRAMAWLTAEAGAGKSYFLEEILSGILRSALYLFNGSSTDKGITAALSNSTVAFAFDEAETADDASKARLETLLRALRSAASASKASRAVGSSGGHARLSKLNGAGFFGSINDAISTDADEQRFLRPKLLAPNANLETAEAVAEAQAKTREYMKTTVTSEFSARFLAFGIYNYSAIVESIEIFAAALERQLGNRRHGLQFGTLLGCAFFYERARVPADGAEALDWCASKNIRMENLVDRVTVRSAADRVVEYVVGKRVETVDGRDRYLISDLLRAAAVSGAVSDGLTQKSANKTLQFHGIKVDADSRVVYFASRHRKMEEMLSGLPEGKNSLDALRSLVDDADKNQKKTTHFSPAGTCSCIAIKLEKLIDIDEGRTEDQTATSLRDRMLASTIDCRNSQGYVQKHRIRDLINVVREFRRYDGGLMKAEAREALAAAGILLEHDDRTITIAHEHPTLVSLLSRGANAVGKEYTTAMRPLIRNLKHDVDFGGMKFNAVVIDDPIADDEIEKQIDLAVGPRVEKLSAQVH